MTKERVSATIDPETKKLLETLLKEDCYRNVSHVIEDAIRKLHSQQKDSKRKRARR